MHTNPSINNRPATKNKSKIKAGSNIIIRNPKLPKEEKEFVALLASVNASWQQDKNLSLLWTTPKVMEEKIEAYKDLQQTKTQKPKVKSEEDDKLRRLDFFVEKAAAAVKQYIKASKPHLSDAISQYSRYGLIQVGSKYILPKERVLRLEALFQLQGAVESDGFGNNLYGNDFWKEIIEEYKTSLNGGNHTEISASAPARKKGELKQELTEILLSLMLLIRANYPSKSEDILTNWGFKYN